MQTESRDEKSSPGDGIYYTCKSASVKSIRKHLLDEYIKDCIHEDGKHDVHQLNSSDLKLLHELDQCYRKFDEQSVESEREEAEERVSAERPARLRTRRPRRKSSRKFRVPREAQQVRGRATTNDSSAFTRLTASSCIDTAAVVGVVDELARARHLCEESNGGPPARLVAHRHQRERPLISSKQQNYGKIIDDRERATSLFIESDIVQPSGPSEPTRQGCFSCVFIKQDSSNTSESNNNNNNNNESQIIRQKIYEPPTGCRASEAAAAASTRANRCQQGSRSWPCYCSSRASVERAHRSLCASRGSTRNNHSFRSLQAALCKRKCLQLHGHPGSSADTSSSTTPSDREDNDPGSQFDIRSALDCVEEIPPTWSDVSSLELSGSSHPAQLEEDELLYYQQIDLQGARREENPVRLDDRVKSKGPPASWFDDSQKMGSDDEAKASNIETRTFQKSDLTSGRQKKQAQVERESKKNSKKKKKKRSGPLGQEEEEEEARGGAETEINLASNQKIYQHQIAPSLHEAANENSSAERALGAVAQSGHAKKTTTKKKKKKNKKRLENLEVETERDKLAESNDEKWGAQSSNWPGEICENSERQSPSQRERSASMRAAKDLAKLSVPSLSSLQYLPGHVMDVKPAKMVDKKRKKAASSAASTHANPAANHLTSGNRTALAKRASIKTNMQQQQQQRQEINEGEEVARPMSIAESREKVCAAQEHDESCLFDRLCLCNCMARTPSHTKRQTKSDSSHVGALAGRSPSPKGSEGEERGARLVSDGRVRGLACASPASCESVDLRSEDEADVSLSSSLLSHIAAESEGNHDSSSKVSPSLRRRGSGGGGEGGTGGSVVRVRDEAPAKPREKQSPTFLGLLKPGGSRARASEAVQKLRGHPLEVRPQINSSDNNKRTPFATSSRVLGSIDDLEASGRSSSASGVSRTNSDFHSPLSSSQASTSASSKSRNRSIGLYKSEKRESGGGVLDEHDDNAGPATSNAPCCYCKSPSPGPNQDTKRSKYKRILSPSKFFTSAQPPSTCGHCKQDHPDKHAEKSFFSRSLSRLSGKPSKQHREPADSGASKSSQENNLRPVEPEPRAASPSAASLTLEQLDECSDSINSLEDIHLSRSLPCESVLPPASKSSTRLLTTPEIVLSRVEYRDTPGESASNCSSCCDVMTRSTTSGGHLGGHNHQHHYHSSHHNNHKYIDGPHRYHSDSHFGSHHRGPHPRRHGSEFSFNASDESTSLTHGPFSLPSSPRATRRQRSPRLSSSPVPFHTPASESTKIEDGLKVRSSEHFEKHIGHIKEDQMDAQKRLFTAWINHFAPNLIVRDLFLELQDGIKLIGLLATLTHDRQLLAEYERLNRDKRSYVNRLALTPSSRLSHISNVHIAIDYMKTKLGMKLVNLNPMDIVSGNETVILALCWNIILHFQLVSSFDLAGSDNSSLASYHSDSRVALSSVGDRASGRVTPRRRNQVQGSLIEELSSKDLVAARDKLLAHINKRFNLRLTNVTSSLLDGDVLLAIIKQMVPQSSGLHEDARLIICSSMSDNDNEKLDLCFQLAQDYLNVPRLISAADLRRQTIGERNSKPLLVYLSMLLRANPRHCSTDQMLELHQLDASLNESREQQAIASSGRSKDLTSPASGAQAVTETKNLNDEIRDQLDELDTGDKFYVDKLQATIDRARQLDEVIRTRTGSGEQLSEDQQRRFSELAGQIEQVESLIAWINKANKLFEAKQESSSDPARAIDLYHRSVSFFSGPNLPQVSEVISTYCPTLERQYRECLAVANQHVHCMEQIMKNWLSHKQASKDLLNWLIVAESKLESALRLNSDASHYDDNNAERIEADILVDRQKSRLDDLIEFFELEPIDTDDFDASNPFFAGLGLEGRSSSLSRGDPAEYSLSGSLMSLGSDASRMSTLTSSKKASHNRLFDNLELQSHLLAAMLEPEHRETILLGVKTFNARMKHMLDQKVPQVISDICMSINRCKMQINKEEEFAGESDMADLTTDEQILEQLVQEHLAVANDNDDRQLSPEARLETAVVVSDDAEEAEASSPPEAPISASRLKKNKHKNRAQTRKKNNSSLKKSSVAVDTLIKSTERTSQASSPCSDDDCVPYYRSLWNKIVRASRISLSFNIVLLICLAGICVVPLIQKDACCELNQAPIPADRFTVNQRPT